MGFGLVDFAIFGFTLVVSASIGIYYRLTGGKQETAQEYLLGNRNQKVVPVAFSLVASFASSISILGTSAEAYNFGTQFFVISFADILSTVCCIFIYLPVFFKLGTISVYEYLEKRFGLLTRILASFGFIVQMILYMGIVHYAPALAMEAVTGIPQVTSIIAIGIICIFYSTIGGIKAVIITDLFQALMMFAAVIAVIVFGLIQSGGLMELWNAAEASGRIQFSNFKLDPTERHTWWSITLGGMLTHMSLYAINQTQVQRYVSMKDYQSAATALLLSCPILIIFQCLVCLAGLSMYYAYKECDPIMEGRISRADQLMPLYVMDMFYAIPGLTGLFAAGIFSASLSTVSAAVNSLAAVTMEDYVAPIYKHLLSREIGDAEKSRVSKILALLYGLVCLMVALTVRSYTSMLQAALTIFGIVGGPLLALFTLGVAFPSANQTGAISGFISGFVFSFVMAFGGKKPSPNPLPGNIDGCANLNFTFKKHVEAVSFTEHNTSSLMNLTHTDNMDEYSYLFRISYFYYIVLSFLISIVVGLIISSLSGSSMTDINPDLLTPYVANRLKKRRGARLSVRLTELQRTDPI